MVTIELTAKEVAMRVHPYVERTTVGDITLSVDEAGIRLQNDYWQIPIRPSREPEWLFPFYETLADLTEELQNKEGLKVTLTAGDALTEEGSPGPYSESAAGNRTSVTGKNGVKTIEAGELTPKQVAERIRPYLAKGTFGDITVRLDEVSIRLQNGYWHVRVHPAKEPEPMFPYFDALVDVQDEVEEKEGLKIDIASGAALTDE